MMFLLKSRWCRGHYDLKFKERVLVHGCNYKYVASGADLGTRLRFRDKKRFPASGGGSRRFPRLFGVADIV